MTTLFMISLCIILILLILIYEYAIDICWKVYMKLKYGNKLKLHKVILCDLLEDKVSDAYNIKVSNFDGYRYMIQLDNLDKIYIKGHRRIYDFRKLFDLDFEIPLK